MTTLILLGFLGPLTYAVADGMRAPAMRYRKVGGIRFLRLGRLQFSFCICRK